MDRIRVVSVIIQDGNGGIESVSRINSHAKIERINKIKRVGIRASQYGVFLSPLRVFSILKNNDVVMTNLPMHHVFFSFVNLFFGRKLICIEHGPWIHAISAKSGLLMSWFYQAWLKASDVKIVCVSKDLYALYNLIRDNNVYIPNAIKKTERLQKKISTVKKFVYAGRFDYQKDTELTIESFLEYTSRIKKRGEYCTLHVYGSGVQEKYLRDKYKKFDNVEFKGHCQSLTEELYSYDVCLLTSRFEGLPGIALEALYSGCKVVCTPFLTGLMELNSLSSLYVANSRNVADIVSTIEMALSHDSNFIDTYRILDENYSTNKVNDLYKNIIG